MAGKYLSLMLIPRTMKKIKKELAALNAAVDALKEKGASVIVAVAQYKKKDAHFHTRVSLSPVKKAKVTKDHIGLDLFREIAGAWSLEAHKKSKVKSKS